MKNPKVWILAILLLFSLPAPAGYRPICCSYEEKSRIVSEVYQCYSNAHACCEQMKNKLFHAPRELLLVEEGVCQAGSLEAFTGDVEICKAPTRFKEFAGFVGLPLDGLSQTLRLHHTWLRTPHKEAGMGPTKKNPIQTEWQDHTGLGEHPKAVCQAIPGCDLQCIEEAMEVGKSTGAFSVINTCHHLVRRVVTKCGCLDMCTKFNFLGYCVQWAYPVLK